MNRIFTILIAILLTASVFAQAPEKMSYQAVIRNSTDQLVTNQGIGMQISILQTTATGTAVYVETHNTTTNANGLVTVEIGNGNVQSGDFSTIDWANDIYFIKTETDPTTAGGTAYTITGTSQLLSVSYALHAKTAESSNNENQQLSLLGNDLSISGTGGNTIALPSSMPTGSDGDMLFHNGTNWTNSPILFHDNNKIGFGNTNPSSRIDVEWDSEYTPGLNVNNSSATDGSVTIRGEAMWSTSGYLGVQGEDNFASILELDLDNHRIGAMGISESVNGYGLYGYGKKYGGYFKNDNLNTVGLAGNDAALEVFGITSLAANYSNGDTTSLYVEGGAVFDTYNTHPIKVYGDFNNPALKVLGAMMEIDNPNGWSLKAEGKMNITDTDHNTKVEICPQMSDNAMIVTNDGMEVKIATENTALEIDGGMKIGTSANTLTIFDIIELTGTTGASGTTLKQVSLPSGWTSDNTRVLSAEIQNSGNLWTNGHNDSGGVYYEFLSSIFYLRYPDNTVGSTYYNRPYRIVLMKIQ